MNSSVSMGVTCFLMAISVPVVAGGHGDSGDAHGSGAHPVAHAAAPSTSGHNAQSHDAGHSSSHTDVTADVLFHQHLTLHENTAGKGFGPQAPRDIDAHEGLNRLRVASAPAYQDMNLCNIHMHENAEHKGGDFTKFAGYGDGHGFGTGYQYSGHLTGGEALPLGHEVCHSDHGGLEVGDTIEVHYVHTTADVQPGPTLGACLSEAVKNPELRVEAQVFVLVNDSHAADFSRLTEVGVLNGFQQAMHIPHDSGTPVQYIGSTTGPNYNEKGSPYQVTWSVRPRVMRVNIETVSQWCKGNIFNEDHAHGVRNLVTDLSLLSPIR